MAVMAQHERELVGARTAALAAAKAHGARLGNAGNLSNRALGTAYGNAAEVAGAEHCAADLAAVVHEMRAAGAASLRQLVTGLNAHCAPAPHGGRWSTAQVSRVPARQAGTT
jgi:DNA invertase Pin-like site-specific DNA recombinase